ncbi:MAG: hypothetical protein WDZ35_13215 [Crocinitomicaceae bacterium]
MNKFFLSKFIIFICIYSCYGINREEYVKVSIDSSKKLFIDQKLIDSVTLTEYDHLKLNTFKCKNWILGQKNGNIKQWVLFLIENSTNRKLALQKIANIKILENELIFILNGKKHKIKQRYLYEQLFDFFESKDYQIGFWIDLDKSSLYFIDYFGRILKFNYCSDSISIYLDLLGTNKVARLVNSNSDELKFLLSEPIRKSSSDSIFSNNFKLKFKIVKDNRTDTKLINWDTEVSQSYIPVQLVDSENVLFKTLHNKFILINLKSNVSKYIDSNIIDMSLVKRVECSD